MTSTPRDFDVRALYDALDAERQSRGLTWTQVARAMSGGISPSTLTGMRDRRVVEGDGVLQMLTWLGRSPESFLPDRAGASHAHELLPDAGPARVLRFDAPALYAALDAVRVERRLSWPQVASEIGGVTAASLTRLAKGGRVAFPDVMRMVTWLGQPAVTFTHAAT